MPKFKDLKGQQFHRLTVLERAENSKSNQTQWLCECGCGKRIVVRSASLINGHTKSCGCYSAELKKLDNHQTTHGLSHTRLHRIWCSMRTRCFNPRYKLYKYYGGRGINICNEWSDFKTFYDWAMSHGYNDSLSIDRIDVNGNYSPDNCRWADKYVQMSNMTTNVYYMFNNEMLTLPQIERKLNYPHGMLFQRINKLGIPFEVAIKYPPHCLPSKELLEMPPERKSE